MYFKSSYHSFLPPLNSVYLPHHYSLRSATFMPLLFTVTIYLQFYFQTIYSSPIFVLPVKANLSASHSASMHTWLSCWPLGMEIFSLFHFCFTLHSDHTKFSQSLSKYIYMRKHGITLPLFSCLKDKAYFQDCREIVLYMFYVSFLIINSSKKPHVLCTIPKALINIALEEKLYFHS